MWAKSESILNTHPVSMHTKFELEWVNTFSDNVRKPQTDGCMDAQTHGRSSFLCLQGSKLRGAEGQNAPKVSPNAPRLLNLGAKFCYPIQPDICFEA